MQDVNALFMAGSAGGFVGFIFTGIKFASDAGFCIVIVESNSSVIILTIMSESSPLDPLI